MQRGYFFDRLPADPPDINIGTDDRDATAQSASREIQEIADRRIHALTAVQNKESSLERDFRKVLGLHHDVRRPDDGAERGAEIVAQHGEKHLVRVAQGASSLSVSAVAARTRGTSGLIPAGGRR